jgi:hypothetical protein
LVGYLAAYFKGVDENIFLSVSNGNTAYEFDALSGGNAYLTPSAQGGTGGVRDPYLVASPDRSNFWIIGTDLNIDTTTWGDSVRTGSRKIYIWNSNDLVNWSADYLVTVEEETAGMVWAPSAAYDETTGRYNVFWSSQFFAQDDANHTGNPTTGQMIRYASTTDFKTFTAPQTYLEGPNGISVIDQEFQHIQGDTWVRFIKDANVQKVYEEVSTTGLFGQWTRVGGSDAYVVNDVREGPASFQDNVDSSKYHLWLDDYSGNGRYIPYETSDILAGGYVQSNAPNFPDGLRHGAVIGLTQSEYE